MKVSRTQKTYSNFQGTFPLMMTVMMMMCVCVFFSGAILLVTRHERPSKLLTTHRAAWRQTPASQHPSCCVKVAQFRPVFEHPTA